LEALKAPDEEFSIAFLSEKLDLPPSTVHRILKTLCDYRFVVRDERAHTYKLGPALIPLGIVVRHNLKIQNSVTSILQKLSSATNEDAYYIIATGYKGLILERAESSNPLKVIDRFGFERYLHSGANRRAILAFQSKTFIDEYIENILKNPKEPADMTPEKLLIELEKIKQEEVAVSYGEYIKGTIGISCPIFDYKGEVKSSMGIIIPTTRIKNPKHIDELKEIVKSHARELSYSIGYSPKTSHLT
jgi:DNA-binding IclR family transcriptional regulator